VTNAPTAMQNTYMASETNTANLGSVFMLSSLAHELAIQAVGHKPRRFCSFLLRYE
jgi:hypothetical protein